MLGRVVGAGLMIPVVLLAVVGGFSLLKALGHSDVTVTVEG
ncbi:hypothetical protein [uncultured Serinicoccus sp.]|nr:hypothetical protein [uncultured Serinicoccus sp.]